jgi:hypothetical protein
VQSPLVLLGDTDHDNLLVEDMKSGFQKEPENEEVKEIGGKEIGGINEIHAIVFASVSEQCLFAQ